MIDAFGIDAAKVYANDNAANPAFWTLFPDHAHGMIVAALAQDKAVLNAVQNKFAHPDDVNIRFQVIDVINRATVNCIGQHIIGQTLQPDTPMFTIYNLLKAGTELDINNVIGAPANTALHDVFAKKDSNGVIALVSRKTGHALLQACIHQLPQLAAANVPTGNILSVLIDLLKSQAGGIIPGLRI